MTTKEVDVKKLFEAGAHFGHKTSRWNPKMSKYIHSKRNGIHIIDLNKTAECLVPALEFIGEVAKANKQILLVGTKLQTQSIVKDMAEKVNQPYVTKRWLGGTLTNWNTIGGRIKHLKDLESKMASGEFNNKYSKLEVQRYQEEIDEMNVLYGGVKDLNGLPAAIFVVDVVHDALAVKEANKLNIPIVGITDSNADPSVINYPIPANDDAIKTIQLICDYVATALTATKSSKGE